MNTFFLNWFFNEYEKTIISRQQLFKAIFEFCVLLKVEDNINLNPKSQYYKAVEQLASSKQIACHQKTQFGYSFFSKSKDSISAEELICLLFPYGSLAYGSALYELKFTNKQPQSVYFKAPSRSLWKKKALLDLPYVPEHLRKQFNLQEYFDYILPIYPYEDIFINKQLIVLSEKNLNLDNLVRHGDLRVQNHFDLLLDTLRKPQYCGGFTHVFEVFNNNIDRFLDGLIHYASNEGTCIDRARLGFMLEKMLFIKHPSLSKWKYEMTDKRGGSRKLIAANNFEEHFDSDWNISLNHSLAQNPPKNRTIRFNLT